MASAVGAELEAIQGGLQRRADIAAARAMLELMQDTAHVMSKVQDLHALGNLHAMQMLSSGLRSVHHLVWTPGPELAAVGGLRGSYSAAVLGALQARSHELQI